MAPNPNHEEKLEQLIHRTLRDLPPRQAPASLEHRVRAELQRRAALPWWKKSFGHWPFAARAAFIVLSAGLVKFAFILSAWAEAGFERAQVEEVVASHFSWVETGLAVVHAVTGFCEIMLRNIPPVWLYAGMAFFAAVYFTLFGLGAAAYKALRVQP